MVDVTVSRIVAAKPEAVARIMFDPSRDAEWIGGARAAEKLTPGPYGVGTRVKRTGGFLGRRFSWVTEVTEFDPVRVVRMKYVAGPFKGGVDYSITSSPAGSEVTIRNYGDTNLWMPFMSTMMRFSVGRDLDRLQKLIGT
jgi:hypothetical protein